MAQEQKMPANNALRPRTAAPRQADSDMMTPKDILAIFRRHTLMIFTTTILGILISGTAWYLLRKYAPKYTAKTIFRVLAPVERDPMAFGTTAAGKDMHYGYRLSLANLIKRQDRLDKLLARDKIKQTRWFMSLGQTQGARLREAIMDLGDNFSAVAQKNTEFITISMTCGSKVESALIVNEMLELFIAEEGTKKRQEVTDRLAKLEERRDRVEQDLAFA
ncbi:MAG: hypothetical protein ACYST9_03495 [Planctomycetota bacterium]|jgi:uncharacterized protein involved in exopolysaccharide biosynthesis